MTLLALSAAFAGLVHSLAPGHWLPVVLMAKLKRWPLRTAILGALAAASGHILISSSIGVLSVVIGVEFLPEWEHDIEKYTGLILLVFGLGYAVYAYFRHSSCHGHTHHGPDPSRTRAPFLFLFSLGFSPCVAALPIIATAGSHGVVATVIILLAFAAGVLSALIGATVVASLGLMRLDHPVFEHYGDVLTGLGIALMGGILAFIPH